LSYDAKPNHQPYVKLTFFFNKLPHVSYEQFHRHWETNWNDWEAFFKLVQSSEYAEALGPDCSDFMDMPIKAMAGYDNIIFDPTVSGSGGKDGIMKL
ncbi:hypothetical protein LTR04_003601, partial [Oleoguttula sp. CCFEE 6159]